MGKISELMKDYNIDEKLIIVNKGKKEGQLAIFAGGGGSGKSSVAAKQVALETYKSFNIDDLKPIMIKLAKLGKEDPALANLDLSKASDADKMHKYVSSKGIFDKKLKTFADSVKRQGGLPNVLLDMVFGNISGAQKRIKIFQDVGYKPENTHIIWVLTDFKVAIDRSAQRGRDVPYEVIFKGHAGVARNMYQFLTKSMPKNIDGEIYIVLNNDDSIVFPKGEEDKPWPRRSFTDFTYLKVKEAGKPVNKKLVDEKVIGWIKDNVPREVAIDF